MDVNQELKLLWKCKKKACEFWVRSGGGVGVGRGEGLVGSKVGG